MVYDIDNEMTDHSIFELRKIADSYKRVSEATAKPNAYKNLTPEQAEMLAQLSPSYSSQQIWGDTSNWICSMANRMIKFKHVPFETAYERARELSNYIVEFEKFSKQLKRDITTIQSFEEFERFMEDAKQNGLTIEGLSQSVRKDGRARQCYSLMKNGGDDFIRTYEDSNYLIGYPTNFAYNSKFSAIGKWCHTGSFGNGEQYWSDYGHYPVFYILNKRTGEVFCASWQGTSGEVRNQKDNYPEGFDGNNWNQFFTNIGLKKPMVDDIADTVGSYVEPDDLEPQSVYDRIDSSFISEYLFNGLDCEVEDDDYGRGTGNVTFSLPIDDFSPDSVGDENTLYTHYSGDVDEETTYTFDEFKDIVHVFSDYTELNVPHSVFNMMIKHPLFSQIWKNDTDLYYHGDYSALTITDDKTMSERMSINDLYDILSGRDVNFGLDYKLKCKDIRKFFKSFVDYCKRIYRENITSMIPDKFGWISWYYRNNRIGPCMEFSIDADEANHLAEMISRGELPQGVVGGNNIDILSLNLGGKTEFSMKRIESDEDFKRYMMNFIAAVKRICKLPKDIPGQMHFEFGNDGNPVYFKDDDPDFDYKISPNAKSRNDILRENLWGDS